MKSFPDRDIINVKLVNNGFFYVSIIGEHISRHKAKDFVRLPRDKCLGYFHTLTTVTSEMFQSAAAFYSCSTQRLDIKFKPKLDVSCPQLMVTYEPGFPYVDDSVEYEPIAANTN